MPAFEWGPLLQGGPLFIGILNLTPDSFSDGGRYLDPTRALEQARGLAAQGCRMLDLGAESTRPGAEPVPPREEWARLEPALGLLRRELPDVPLSLDTRHAGVAEKGLAAGVAVLNDVTGFSDPQMMAVARASACGLIAMRSRVADRRLLMPSYGGALDGDAIEELRDLRARLLGEGIEPGRILLDPGFGFGTTFAGDAALWSALAGLPAALDWPADRVCIGISRKRFLAHRAGAPQLPPDQRDALTAQAHREAHAFGYRVFRTHAATLA